MPVRVLQKVLACILEFNVFPLVKLGSSPFNAPRFIKTYAKYSI